MSTFLREKARVTSQLRGERNFHILHQLAAAAAAAAAPAAAAAEVAAGAVAPIPALGHLALPAEPALLLRCVEPARGSTPAQEEEGERWTAAQDGEGWRATVRPDPNPSPSAIPTPTPRPNPSPNASPNPNQVRAMLAIGMGLEGAAEVATPL